MQDLGTEAVLPVTVGRGLNNEPRTITSNDCDRRPGGDQLAEKSPKTRLTAWLAVSRRLARAIRAPESTSSPGFATQLFFQVFFSIRRKIRRAGKYAGNASAARGFQGAGLKRGSPLLALGRYGWHGIS